MLVSVILLTYNCTVKESCIQGIITFHAPWKHHVYITIMLKHVLLFRVESESETILVEQVVEGSQVVSEFDNCGTNPEPEIVNEGKPWFMH